MNNVITLKEKSPIGPKPNFNGLSHINFEDPSHAVLSKKWPFCFALIRFENKTYYSTPDGNIEYKKERPEYMAPSFLFEGWCERNKRPDILELIAEHMKFVVGPVDKECEWLLKHL